MARPRTDIEPRVVRAARARFLAEGVDGASLRTIARDAKTSVGMISYYFPTKDDLFLAVVEQFYAKLLDDLARCLAGRDPVRERLRRVFARIGAASEGELAVVRLVAREALLSSTRLQRVIARAQRGHVAMLFQALGEGARRGEIDPALPAPLLLISVFALGGAPQLARRAAGARAIFAGLPDVDRLAELSAELLFRAIGPPDRAGPREPSRPARRVGAARKPKKSKPK